MKLKLQVLTGDKSLTKHLNKPASKNQLAKVWRNTHVIPPSATAVNIVESIHQFIRINQLDIIKLALSMCFPLSSSIFSNFHLTAMFVFSVIVGCDNKNKCSAKMESFCNWSAGLFVQQKFTFMSWMYIFGRRQE